MAKITVSSRFGLDIRDINFSYLYEANSFTSTSTLFRANYGGGAADEFRGTGFRYNSQGEPIAGTITSYAGLSGSTKVFALESFSLAATKIVAAARTTSTADDVKLMASVLSGNDTFKGGNATDFIRMYAGNDTILGNGGNDSLYGGSGNDKITGGAGRDKLYGESGSDTFIFKSRADSTVSSSGRDTIYDFTSADTIDLAGIDANTNISGNQGFSFIGTKAFTGRSGDLRYEKKASDTYIYGDVNGDKVADFAIHLDDAVTLSKGDFIL
ncbi:hypothetical protein [Ciceribacter sp. L1K22]|uniref:calcium-binding protein n=1 Tax=Ciceribacter sp. L1K22 TaxID=2820275 RepID=UPI0032B2C579